MHMSMPSVSGLCLIAVSLSVAQLTLWDVVVSGRGVGTLLKVIVLDRGSVS